MTDSVCPDLNNYEWSVLGGEPARWEVRPWRGDTYDRSWFRSCSFCGSMHPEDAIEAVRRGCRVEGTGKSYKRYLMAPNPVGGRMVRTGTTSGPVWRGRAPSSLWGRLTARTDLPATLGRATLRERLSGRYSRALRSRAPATMQAKLYMWHFTEAQRLQLAELSRQ